MTPRNKKIAPAGSGNLNGVTAGTTTPGTALSTSVVHEGGLECLFTVLAETNTLTITGKFQVSVDGVTWRDIAGDAQNPANVVMATGTASADPTVNMVLPVPSGTVGWQFIRPAIVSAGTTGAAADTFAFEWHYVDRNSMSRD